ncbi:MAG: hypothetical protein ACLGXA_11825, partial [Acidobacteriota bacterium]
ASGDMNLPSGAKYKIGGKSLLSSSPQIPGTCAPGMLWINPKPTSANDVIAVCFPANRFIYLKIR